MPSPEALDSMSRMIAGCDWAALQYPEHRAQIMTLALADERNAILDVIEGHLDSIYKQGGEVKSVMENIDSWIQPMGEWFEKSKLWEGRLL